MNKWLFAAALGTVASQAPAACPTADGTWVIETALKPPSLTKLKQNFQSATAHVKIENGILIFVQGVTSTIRYTPFSIGISTVRLGYGTVTLDPVSCRLGLSYATTSSGFATTTKGSKAINGSEQISGKGTYAKFIRGFSGRYSSKSNGLTLQGTFNMYPE